MRLPSLSTSSLLTHSPAHSRCGSLDVALDVVLCGALCGALTLIAHVASAAPSGDEEHHHQTSHISAPRPAEAAHQAQRLAAIDSELIGVITRREALRDELRELTPRLLELQGALGELEGRLALRRQALTRALTLRRRLKGSRVAELLLSSEGPLELKRREVSLQALFRSAAGALERLSADLNKLKTTEQTLRAQRERAAQMSRELSAQVETLTQLRAQEAALLGSAQGEDVSLESGERLSPPLVGLWSDRFQSHQGPYESRLYGHGVWIPGAPGAPVYAVDEGVVRFVGWVRGRGDVVIISHKRLGGRAQRETLSVYAGLTPSVKVGDEVKRQAQIGALDAHLTERGLSFELRQGATPLYPRRWVQEVPLLNSLTPAP